MNLKQSRLGSFAESVTSTAAGFGLSLACQWLFFNVALGLPLAFEHNIVFALIMTAVSIGRQFVLRRVFEYFRISRNLSAGMLAVIAERFRQVEVKGWTAAHDRLHNRGELAQAAAAYVLWAVANRNGDTRALERWRENRVPGAPPCFPWTADWWKPVAADYRHNMVVAGALIAAELDRHDGSRAAPPDPKGHAL